MIHDGAHNPAGAAALAEALPEIVGDRPLTGVFAILDDKDAAGILDELIPLCTHAVLTRCEHPRALPPGTLASLAGRAPAPPCSRRWAIHARPSSARGGSRVRTGPCS